MVRSIIILSGILFFIACNNGGSSRQTTDSATMHITTGNVSDGGPNNGRGDTNSYDRMNDKINDSTLKSDTLLKK